MGTNTTRRTTTRRLAAMALVAALLALTACAPAPGGAPPEPTDPVPGYVRVERDPLVAYTVTVDPTVPEPVAEAVRSAAAAAQDASGIELSVRTGVVGPSPGRGEVTVTMGLSCGVPSEAGCATLWVQRDRRLIVGTKITVAPATVTAPYLWVTVAHELGHALGLGHLDTAGHRRQVMDARTPPLDRYQRGDLAGLAHAGRDARTAAGVEPAGGSVPAAVTAPQVAHGHG